MKINKVLCCRALPGTCLAALAIFAGAVMPACAQESSFPVLEEKYIDKDGPGGEAAVFAKGIVSTGGYEHSAPAFSPDGKTVIWGIVERDKPCVLLEMHKVSGKWTRPPACTLFSQNKR